MFPFHTCTPPAGPEPGTGVHFISVSPALGVEVLGYEERSRALGPSPGFASDEPRKPGLSFPSCTVEWWWGT